MNSIPPMTPKYGTQIRTETPIRFLKKHDILYDMAEDVLVEVVSLPDDPNSRLAGLRTLLPAADAPGGHLIYYTATVNESFCFVGRPYWPESEDADEFSYVDETHRYGWIMWPRAYDEFPHPMAASAFEFRFDPDYHHLFSSERDRKEKPSVARRITKFRLATRNEISEREVTLSTLEHKLGLLIEDWDGEDVYTKEDKVMLRDAVIHMFAPFITKKKDF